MTVISFSLKDKEDNLKLFFSTYQACDVMHTSRDVMIESN